MSKTLEVLLNACLTREQVAAVLRQTAVVALPPATDPGLVTRAQIAQAMNLVLFHDLIQRVPAAQAYVEEDVVAAGRRTVFDHGAIRTVRWASGQLPQGERAFTRIFEPLGYRLEGVYPLPRLRMTGRAWCHEDEPEGIAQFFVSELHPEQFSEDFQATVTRVLASSRDPLSPLHVADLAMLAVDRTLPLANAVRLVPALVRCFGRQHEVFALADYEALRAESAEMAWIATEGNAFNHATDRVDDVVAVAEAQRRRGRPIKDTVEVSASGRVRQTAFRAVDVRREFLDGDERVVRQVPGSFYEFISRDPLPGVRSTDRRRLDLAFDSGNATGIFAMTAGREAVAS